MKKLRNLFKDTQGSGGEEEKDMKEKELENKVPGTFDIEEDIGKKVFEKTGRLREGVGQSSTPVPEDHTSVVPKKRPLKKRENAVEPEIESYQQNIAKPEKMTFKKGKFSEQEAPEIPTEDMLTEQDKPVKLHGLKRKKSDFRVNAGRRRSRTGKMNRKD